MAIPNGITPNFSIAPTRTPNLFLIRSISYSIRFIANSILRKLNLYNFKIKFLDFLSNLKWDKN